MVNLNSRRIIIMREISALKKAITFTFTTYEDIEEKIEARDRYSRAIDALRNEYRQIISKMFAAKAYVA